MRHIVVSIVVSVLMLAFFLAGGILCTFYTRWLQRIYTSDRYGPRLDLFYHTFGKRLSQSRYFIWHIRTVGIGALVAAALTLFALIRGLAGVLLSGK